MLEGRKIVVAVSGGIAAYKSAALVSLLTKRGADVRVAMTPNAAQFITPLTLETLSKNAVICDTFDRSAPYEVSHISINKFADAIVVAPATADIIAKAASGIADDFVSTMLLAATSPVIFAPAMNTAMYKNPATVRNIERLKADGKLFISPQSGLLACGETGEGRMSEPEHIADYLEDLLNRRTGDFFGSNILVTAGPTIEDIDDVRFISNRSSGKMGYALAEAALARGASVTLVSGPCRLEPPAGARVINVRSAADMKKAVFENFEQADIIIKAAAVADYTPLKKVDGKIKKGADMTLELKRTEDILLELGKVKGRRRLVGFAAEAEDLIKNAAEKLERKNVDMICANDISRSDIGFEAEKNALTLLMRSGQVSVIEKCGKREAADAILDAIKTL